MLTHKELIEKLKYDKNTGNFFWINSNARRKAGDLAGHILHTGYLGIGLNGKKYLYHRLAWFYMTGEWPKNQIDHVNCIRSDNRFDNLREATNSQNSMNKKMQKNNTTGMVGVSINKGRGKKYISSIWINGKYISLGRYDSAIEASIAYQNKANEIFKEFKYRATDGKQVFTGEFKAVKENKQENVKNEYRNNR